MKYWTPHHLLPYQRNFNLVNSVRGIGKTYGFLQFAISRALDKGEQFVYLTRTQDEQRQGALEKATTKVRAEQFPDIEFFFDSETMRLENKNGPVLGYCMALSAAYKAKRTVSMPDVKWLFFDEYILEPGSIRYVRGWNEPDLLLNLYHTIDREKDKVVCFLCANNISFYNPYHLHPAFSIPACKKGEIWTSENVLFEWADASEELQEEKNSCRFLRMIEGTSYGKYARDGEYIEDRTALIEKRPSRAKLRFNVVSNGNPFGVWYDDETQVYYIDAKCNLNALRTYSGSIEDHKPGMRLLQKTGNLDIIIFSDAFKSGRGRFSSMEVQAKCLEWVHKIV